MSSCEKDSVLGGKRIVLPGEGDYGNYRVRGEGDIVHRDVVEGDELVTYLSLVPYSPPVSSIGFEPAIIEKGLVINKDGILVKGSVTKGKEEVVSIQLPELLLDVANPVLPFAIDGVAGDPVALGNTEVLHLNLTVQDSKIYKKTASLVRPDRVFFGAIGKDPRIASVAELIAAAFATTDGVKGELMSAMPAKYTFACNNNFWFILVPASWNFSMKTDLNFNPAKESKGSFVANPNTTFAQGYNVFCGTTMTAGDVTYQFYGFSK